MRVVDCTVLKQEWIHEIGRRGNLASTPDLGANVDAGKWQRALAKLAELERLGDDWDGAGAKAPSPETVASARALAYLLSAKGVDPPHCVVPGFEGELNFEWQFSGGTYVEIEIVRPLYAEVMVMEPGKPARFWTLPADQVVHETGGHR